MKEYDVIIIGGGITGAGIARDCALRGLKTILFEKNHFSSGATSTSTGLIHGGMRYLLYDVPTTKISCIDSGYIYKIAPHLLSRKIFLMPIFKNHPQGIEKTETVLEIYDRYQPLKGGKPHQRLTKKEALKLEPGLSPEITGALTLDEWGVDPYKLTMANLKSAGMAGADVVENVGVTGFLQENHAVVGIETKNIKVRGKIVCNATGPWGSAVAKLAGAQVNLRPAKGVHLVFEPALSPFGIITDAVDGRFIFMVPRENSTLIGCTDDDYYGDLDDVSVNSDEISYLLEAARRVFPKIKEHQPLGTTAGLRPTLFQWGKTEDELSREFMIFNHEEREGIKGLITVVGGKMAIYRLMAEETTDLICQKLGKGTACQTHEQSLPEVPEFDEFNPVRNFTEKDRRGIKQFFLGREDVVGEEKAEVSKKRKVLATLNLAIFYFFHYLRKLNFRKKKGLKQFRKTYHLRR